jgi:hypothetical protein
LLNFFFGSHAWRNREGDEVIGSDEPRTIDARVDPPRSDELT